MYTFVLSLTSLKSPPLDRGLPRCIFALLCKASVLALGIVYFYLYDGLFVPLHDVHCVSVSTMSILSIDMTIKNS